jgi:hypothetical protein
MASRRSPTICHAGGRNFRKTCHSAGQGRGVQLPGNPGCNVASKFHHLFLRPRRPPKTPGGGFWINPANQAATRIFAQTGNPAVRTSAACSKIEPSTTPRKLEWVVTDDRQ